MSLYRIILEGCSTDHLVHWDVSLPQKFPRPILDCMNPRVHGLIRKPMPRLGPGGNLDFPSVRENPVILVSLPITVIKCSSQSTLRNEDLIPAHSSRVKSVRVGRLRQQELELLVTSQSQPRPGSAESCHSCLFSAYAGQDPIRKFATQGGWVFPPQLIPLR